MAQSADLRDGISFVYKLKFTGWDIEEVLDSSHPYQGFSYRDYHFLCWLNIGHTLLKTLKIQGQSKLNKRKSGTIFQKRFGRNLKISTRTHKII